METDKTSQTIKLQDGRKLGFAEYGNPEGTPVMFFHAGMTCRLGADGLAEKGQELGLSVRIVAPDRPGIGLSDYQPERTLLDWPDDVAQLADTLGLGKFAVLGVSAGGPHAIACAHKIAERITHAVISSCGGPFDIPGIQKGMDRMNWTLFFLARRIPFLARLMLNQTVALAKRDPARYSQQVAKSMPAVADRTAFLETPEMGSRFAAEVIENHRQGPRGELQEMSILGHAWNIPLQEITVPVHLWHGEDDANAPVAMGRYVASAIPTCQARFILGEGHLSVAIKYMDEMLRVAVS